MCMFYLTCADAYNYLRSNQNNSVELVNFSDIKWPWLLFVCLLIVQTVTILKLIITITLEDAFKKGVHGYQNRPINAHNTYIAMHIIVTLSPLESLAGSLFLLLPTACLVFRARLPLQLL